MASMYYELMEAIKKAEADKEKMKETDSTEAFVSARLEKNTNGALCHIEGDTVGVVLATCAIVKGAIKSVEENAGDIFSEALKDTIRLILND